MIKSFFQRHFVPATLDASVHTVKLPVASTALDGFRIVHISDLHIDTHTKPDEILSLVDKLNSMASDIVVITGDIIDCKVRKIEQRLLLLQGIKHPTYYVSGNHDLVYGYEALQKIMCHCGIVLLDNRYKILQYRGKKIILAGLSDRYSRFFGILRHAHSVAKTIRMRGLPVIFLAHQPKDYRYALAAKSDLFLCGHTHGGQIFPFNHIIRLAQPFVKGRYIMENMSVYVNRGIGAWGIKYRFLVDYEIASIRLGKL